MATTTTSSLGSQALGIYFDKKVVESLQPYLYFEQFGTVEYVSQGNYFSRFVVVNKIATSSVSTLTEGTPPTSIAFGVSTVERTPTQYGVNVELTDLVVLTSFFDLINSTLVEVGKVIARKIDSVIQTVVNAGDNVIYPNNKNSRNDLADGDLIDVRLIIRAVQKLRANNAPEFPGGGYACVMHPAVAHDLMSNPSTGQWLDIRKHAAPENIFTGEVGSVGGARVVQTSNVDTFSSNVTVYPTTLIGADAYRIAYWLPGKVSTYVLPPESNLSVNNPLGQRGSVGAKVNMAVAITQQERLVRIESAASTL